MKPLKEQLEEVEKKLQRNLDKGWNDEKLNTKYRLIIKEKFGLLNLEIQSGDKAKEVTKMYNAKTGKYEN
jgi:hypothetical protein